MGKAFPPANNAIIYVCVCVLVRDGRRRMRKYRDKHIKIYMYTLHMYILFTAKGHLRVLLTGLHCNYN